MVRYWVVAAAFVALVAGFLLLANGRMQERDAARAEVARDEPVRLTQDQQDQFIEIIRSRGLLCAKVIEARKRQAQTYYVECETHPDKLERKAYTLDLATNRAR